VRRKQEKEQEQERGDGAGAGSGGGAWTKGQTPQGGVREARTGKGATGGKLGSKFSPHSPASVPKASGAAGCGQTCGRRVLARRKGWAVHRRPPVRLKLKARRSGKLQAPDQPGSRVSGRATDRGTGRASAQESRASAQERHHLQVELLDMETTNLLDCLPRCLDFIAGALATMPPAPVPGTLKLRKGSQRPDQSTGRGSRGGVLVHCHAGVSRRYVDKLYRNRNNGSCLAHSVSCSFMQVPMPRLLVAACPSGFRAVPSLAAFVRRAFPGWALLCAVQLRLLFWPSSCALRASHFKVSTR